MMMMTFARYITDEKKSPFWSIKLGDPTTKALFTFKHKFFYPLYRIFEFMFKVLHVNKSKK